MQKDENAHCSQGRKGTAGCLPWQNSMAHAAAADLPQVTVNRPRRSLAGFDASSRETALWDTCFDEPKVYMCASPSQTDAK